MKPSKMLKITADAVQNKRNCSDLDSMILAIDILEALSEEDRFFDYRRTATKIFKEEHGQDVEFNEVNIKTKNFIKGLMKASEMPPERPDSLQDIYEWEDE